MTHALRLFVTAVFVSLSGLALADGHQTAQVLFLGEQHDNPAHHQRQAEIVAQVVPKALVFEMLTPEQAALVTAEVMGDPVAMEEVLGWNASGWPDFAMYYPIFAAAPDAAFYGAAIPRDQARRVMSEGTVAVFGPEAGRFGLLMDLPLEEQQLREQLQLEAHCNAMPGEMLPVMVSIQRLRDAVLAQRALQALQDTGGPVAVITGNGHARKDWGAPAALMWADNSVTVWALGQGEQAFGAPDGGFDRVEISADVDRGDPCAAFTKPSGN